MSIYIYQCLSFRDFLLLVMLYIWEDVIKIYKFIFFIVNIIFNLIVIKVINYNYNYYFKDRGSEVEKVNGILLKLY